MTSGTTVFLAFAPNNTEEAERLYKAYADAKRELQAFLSREQLSPIVEEAASGN